MPKKKPSTAPVSQRAQAGPTKRADRDRRVRQAERLARVLGILERIQGRGRWTKKAIAEELGCSERTVRRDLQVLLFAGVPYYQEGREQFVRVRPDYRFPVLMLTEDEALGQALATAAMKSPGLDIGAGAAATTRKLEAASSPELKEILADARQLICVLDLKLADHSKHREAIRSIQFALLEGRQISGDYESPYQEEPVKLRLHPYRLCLLKSAWYLIGRPIDSESPKTYRVARFKALRLLDQPADVPDEFDLKEYFGNAWAVYRGETTYDIEIWFTPDAAKLVTETTWHPTQKVKSHKDGSATLSFRVAGLEEITGWVLAWAGQCKVIQPAELRQRVIERFQRAIEMHREGE